MRRVIFILSLLLPVWLFSQTPRIDNLRKSVAFLTDSTRIDSMSALSALYIDNSVKDSAEYYATLAYNQSLTLHYVHGLAESLSLQGNMKTFFYGNLPEAEKLDKESVWMYQKTANKAGLAVAYDHLGLCLLFPKQI